MKAGHESLHEIEVFYDGLCPICVREMRFIQGKDRRRSILFTDLSASSFEARSRGLDAEALMDRIHARYPDGRIIEGVEVFRQLYARIGWAWVVRLSRMPVLSRLLDAGYRLFAQNRLRLTGRCDGESCSITANPRAGWLP